MKLTLALATAGMMIAASVPFSGSALAQEPVRLRATQSSMDVAAIVPLSMRYFCAQNKSQCAASKVGSVTMSPDLMSLLKQVNGHVNRNIRPQADTADVWELNPASGDCEDYVLSKRSALISRGVAGGALRIAYTHTRSGQPHAVLVVRTSDGDFVLDNLTNSIKSLRASGYTIRSMSSNDPTKWSAS